MRSADMNPVYLDPEFAEKSRFGGIVSPPVMLQAWTMPAPKIEGIAERGGVPIEMGSNPAAFIEEAGYTGIVATNSEFEIERYPRLGDVISVTQVFEDISDEKKTSLGTGYFVTWLSTYTDQNGEVLGRQRFRVFRFKAKVPPDGELMATRLAPTISPDTEFFWNGVRDHKLLIQRCTGCQALRQPARPMCPTCNSLDWDTIESIRPRHRVQLRDAAAPADAADGVPVHRRAWSNSTKVCGWCPTCAKSRPPTSKSACPSRSSTRRSTPSTAKTSCCTSSGRPG